MATGAPIPAPHRAPRTIALNASIVAQIAYYVGVSRYWPGAYAPRGWHCRIWSGADGTFMIVTPEPPPYVSPPGGSGLPAPITGSGVEASISVGGTGGRYEVAQVTARFFPQKMRVFIQKIRTEDTDLPAAHFLVRPYPDDVVTRVGDPPSAPIDSWGQRQTANCSTFGRCTLSHVNSLGTHLASCFAALAHSRTVATDDVGTQSGASVFAPCRLLCALTAGQSDLSRRIRNLPRKDRGGRRPLRDRQ